MNPPPLLINLKNSWLPRVFAAAGGLALVVASRGYASPKVRRLLIMTASLVVEHRL